MAKEIRHAPVELPHEYKGIFSFGPEEMPRISPIVMEHWLNVDPVYRPVAQKKRHMASM